MLLYGTGILYLCGHKQTCEVNMINTKVKPS